MILPHKHIPSAMLLENNLENFKTFMNIIVTKPAKNKWEFPCKGISIAKDGPIVAFYAEHKGFVLDPRKSSWIRYSNYEGWDMKTFIPVVEPTALNLEILETSPFLRDKSNNIIKIKKIEVLRYVVYPICEAPIIKSFDSIQEEEKFLSGLEILPKGTEIKIIIST